MKRLLEKSDINAGYTENQVKSLQKEEAGIRGGSVERGRAVDKSGRVVFSNTGDSGSVRIPLYARQGNVTTHNHPRQSWMNPNSLAVRVGQSFSGADIANMLVSGAEGTRVVAGGYTFNIRQTDRTNRSASPRAVKSTWTKAYNSYKKSMSSYLRGAKDETDYRRRFERVIIMANHKASQATADKYGLKYTRKRS